MDELDGNQFKLDCHNFSVILGIIRTIFYSWRSYAEILKMSKSYGLKGPFFLSYMKLHPFNAILKLMTSCCLFDSSIQHVLKT